MKCFQNKNYIDKKLRLDKLSSDWSKLPGVPSPEAALRLSHLIKTNSTFIILFLNFFSKTADFFFLFFSMMSSAASNPSLFLFLLFWLCMWVGVNPSEWNAEGKLGHYSPQLRQKLLPFRSPPHPRFSRCHRKPSPQTRQRPQQPEASSVPLFLFFSFSPLSMWNRSVLSEPGLNEKGTVSRARLCQWRRTKTPTRLYFPPQHWAPKSKLTAIHAQNTWAKAEGGDTI